MKNLIRSAQISVICGKDFYLFPADLADLCREVV